MSPEYREDSLQRADVDAWRGFALLDFGTGWCGHCKAAGPVVDAWVSRHPGLRHVRVEDGSGRRLGRSFRVKLWPSLILLSEGEELARVVRPREAEDLQPLEAALGDARQELNAPRATR